METTRTYTDGKTITISPAHGVLGVECYVSDEHGPLGRVDQDGPNGRMRFVAVDTEGDDHGIFLSPHEAIDRLVRDLA